MQHDQGYQMLQFEVHIAKFEIFKTLDFKQVFQKTHMTTFRVTFDPIFGIFGLFYDICNTLVG